MVFLIIILHAWMFCLNICLHAPHMCLEPEDARKGHWIPQELELPTSVSHCIGAGNKPQSSGRVANVLKHLAIAPAP